MLYRRHSSCFWLLSQDIFALSICKFALTVFVLPRMLFVPFQHMRTSTSNILPTRRTQFPLNSSEEVHNDVFFLEQDIRNHIAQKHWHCNKTYNTFMSRKLLACYCSGWISHICMCFMLCVAGRKEWEKLLTIANWRVTIVIEIVNQKAFILSLILSRCMIC